MDEKRKFLISGEIQFWMAKKFRRSRSSIRAATKTQETNIVKNAKLLLEEPLAALPKCMYPGCKGIFGKCYFKKEFGEIEKIRIIKKDEKKLARFSRGKSLPAAVAGTLLIAHAEKAPYLAAAKLPHVTVTYAKRGDADWEKLVGVQYFTDSRLRLLSVGEKAMKKGLHIYSSENQMLCTGNAPRPPDEFIQFLGKKLNFDTEWTCKHLNKKIVDKKQAIDTPYIRIEWPSGNRIIAMCEECVSDNTLNRLTQFFYSPRDEFNVEVVSKEIGCKGGCKDCSIKGIMAEKIKTDDYLEGKISDKHLIDRARREVERKIEELDKRIIVMDEKCYGSDVTKFIQDLNPTKAEMKGLNYILYKISRPLIIPKSTPNKILEKFWGEYGEEVLREIVKDDKTVEAILKKNAPPSEMVEKAEKLAEEKMILDDLPLYDRLPPLAELADRVARGYKVRGEQEVLKIISQVGKDTKEKSIAYAFLLAIGRGNEESWKYSQVEKDFGEHLRTYAQDLLKAREKKYHDALQKLIFATGSTEKI